MSLRFIGFLFSVVFISSLYITWDSEMYLLGDTYDMLLQDMLFVIDYLFLSIYIFVAIFKKHREYFYPPLYLFAWSYLIFFTCGLLFGVLFRDLYSFHLANDIYQILGRGLHVFAFYLLVKRYLSVAFKNKINWLIFLICAVLYFLLPLNGYSSFIYFAMITVYFLFGHTVYLFGSNKLKVLLIGILLVASTEMFYVIKIIEVTRIVDLFIFRLMSSAGELLVVYGLFQICELERQKVDLPRH